MSNYKTHLEIPYPEVERYADKNGLNIESVENFREARIACFNEQKGLTNDFPDATFEPVKVGLNSYEDKIRLAFGNLTFFFPREQASIVASELIKLGDHKIESKEGEEK